MPTAIYYHQGGLCPDTILPCGLSPNSAEYIQVDDFGLPLKLILDPAHDRFNKVAGTSKVAVEVDDGWLAGCHHRL